MKRLKPYIFTVFLILSGTLFFRMEDVRREAYAQVLQPFEEFYDEVCGNGEGRGDRNVYDAESGEADMQSPPGSADGQGPQSAPGGTDGQGPQSAPGSADGDVREAGSGSVVSGPGGQTEGEGTGEKTGTGGEAGTARQPDEPAWHFGPAPEGYFDDALFIGDSRTVGLKEYGGLEQSTFYCSTGLTVYRMFTEPIVKVPDSKKKITVEEALGQRQFGKIYLMIGINEMGTGTVDSFIKKYREQVDRLRELQPDAVIYLQGIMRVTTERSQKGDYINNEGIDARNAEIAKIADNKSIFYLDVNPVLCDEDGGLTASYTHDGVHLRAAYVLQWKDFLQENAALKGGRPVNADEDNENNREEHTGEEENDAGMQKDEWAGLRTESRGPVSFFARRYCAPHARRWRRHGTESV